MRRFLATCLAAWVCSAAALSAQSSPRAVSAVRLTFQRVDQVALDFGVDTTAMRREVIQRLGDAGIAVANTADLPELVIAVRVPKRLVPMDDGFLIVQMELREAATSPTRRTIWNDRSGGTGFTTYGSLRELVPAQIARGLDALAIAHADANTR